MAKPKLPLCSNRRWVCLFRLQVKACLLWVVPVESISRPSGSMKLNNGLYKPEVSWRKKFSGFLAIGHFSFLKKPVSQSMPLNLEIGDLRVAVAEGVAIAEACCIHVFSKFCLLGKPWIEDGELGGGFVKDFLFNSPGELIQFDSYKWVETTN